MTAAKDMCDILARATTCIIHNIEIEDVHIEERKGFLQISYFTVLFLMHMTPLIHQARTSSPTSEKLRSILVGAMFNFIDECLFRVVAFEVMFDADPSEQIRVVRSIIQW